MIWAKQRIWTNKCLQTWGVGGGVRWGSHRTKGEAPDPSNNIFGNQFPLALARLEFPSLSRYSNTRFSLPRLQNAESFSTCYFDDLWALLTATSHSDSFSVTVLAGTQVSDLLTCGPETAVSDFVWSTESHLWCYWANTPANWDRPMPFLLNQGQMEITFIYISYENLVFDGHVFHYFVCSP